MLRYEVDKSRVKLPFPMKFQQLLKSVTPPKN